MKKKRKIYIVIILLIIIVAIATMIIKGISKKRKKEDQVNTSFVNNVATSEVVIEEIEFQNITKEYNGGITTIRAEAYNNTKETKNINVKIVLKDTDGNYLTSMIQAIEGIPAKGKKVLQTGIVGNYLNVDNIQFQVLTESEIQQFNQ